MKVCVRDEPPIPKEVGNEDTLLFYLAKSLCLIPERGKGDVVIELLRLFRRIAPVKEGVLREGDVELPVKNGAMKAKDILAYLRARGVSVSQSQFYVTYLSRLLESGIIVKKRGASYGLRSPTLELTMIDLLGDLKRMWEKVAEHAKRVDQRMER